MKTRFDGLDVQAMVCHLQRTLLGAKVVNIYDGHSDNNHDTYAIKLTDMNNCKTFLVLQSGIRFHDAANTGDDYTHTQPSPFCSKLRKHLRGLRLERVRQIGSDRVVLFSFLGRGGAFSLILELYAKGNLILTQGNSFEIVALLRSHVYQTKPKQQQQQQQPSEGEGEETQSQAEGEDVEVRVGKVYPVTYATNTKAHNSTITNSENATASTTQQPQPDEPQSDGLLSENYATWIQTQIQQQSSLQQSTAPNGKKSKVKALTPKTLLLKPSSGVSHYGPALLEHVICTAELKPHKALSTTLEGEGDDALAGIAIKDWQVLRDLLRTEAPAVLERLQEAAQHETPGYLLYKELPNTTQGDTMMTASSDLPHPDKILLEFLPHLLKQHEHCLHVETRHFGQAVTDFFAQLQAQKRHQKARAAEQAAAGRLANIQADQEQRVRALEHDIEQCQQRAAAVEQNAVTVDQALAILNSALDSGMDWEQLNQVLKVEQEEHKNPIALMIQELRLEHDEVVLRLPVAHESGDDNDQTPYLDVPISLKETAHANASRLFALYRASKDKSRKTMEASEKALQAAQATAQRQLAQAQKDQKLTVHHATKRKSAWFEKFHWMITRDNYLVIAGKDAHQNELLVKRYLRAGDAYLHADVHGAASCILRAKRKRQKGTGKSIPCPLSEQALNEAGQFTICHSSAWNSRMVTSAWWVESHQVSKTAPTGEYLTVGSFMVRGKKNYLPPAPLELGLAVLFRLGDAESIARHKDKERRDFMLLNDPDSDEAVDSEIVEDNTKAGKRLTVNDHEEVVNAQGPKEQDRSNDPHDATQPMDAGERFVQQQSESEQEAVSLDESSSVAEVENTNGSNNVTESTQDSPKGTKKTAKKGLSVKDRKLIKKYGSLEAAEDAMAQQHQGKAPTSALLDGDETVSVASTTNTEKSTKRGKKSKLKRQKQKYADQDEEDRELALMLLQGSGSKATKQNRKDARNKGGPKTKMEQQVGVETASVLVKDPKLIADRLPTAVRDKLLGCTRVDKGDGTYDDRLDQIDGNVMEQLVDLELEEAQMAAVNRLASLNESTQIDNLTSSLAGIVRTIRKFGHKNMQSHSGGEKTEAPNQPEQDDNDFIEDEEDEIDDTVELNKLTGKAHADDVIICAVPVLAPYSTVSQYQYRVKLTPGNGKRGCYKQCVELMVQQQQLLQQVAKKSEAVNSNSVDLHRDLIKRITDNDWIQQMISGVKLSSAGSNKLKQQKGKGKKKK